MPYDDLIKPCDMLGFSEPQDIHESHTSQDSSPCVKGY